MDQVLSFAALPLSSRPPYLAPPMLCTHSLTLTLALSTPLPFNSTFARPPSLVLQKYMQQPNLAAYLGLHPVDALHMSVPLNIMFIGFKGEGNAKVCVIRQVV